MCKVISIVNQKGGVGKSATATNLSAALVREGYKVLAIDFDSQGNLTESLGFRNYDDQEDTIYELMSAIIKESPLPPNFYILHQEEGIDLIPSNISLADLDIMLVNTMSREFVFKQLVTMIKENFNYDYILVDCMPGLGMLTINALVATDEVIIPVEQSYLPIKGLQMLLRTIAKVRRQLNPSLKIKGILFTLVNNTNEAKDNMQTLRDVYGSQINIFDVTIPFTVKIKESVKSGISIFKYLPSSKAAASYRNIAMEVINIEK